MSTLRTALFIDGANLSVTCRNLGFDIDFRKLLREFQSRGPLLRAFYYTTVVEDQEYSSLRPLLDWLGYNGYRVVTKAVREFTDASGGRRRTNGSMDVDLAVDALDLAPHLDQMVLFSGDGDFRPLVESMQRRGVRVTVVSSVQTQPSMVSDDLRRQADEFLDVANLIPRIGREAGERGPRGAEGGRGAEPGRTETGRGEAGRGGEAVRPAAVGLERRYGIRTGADDPEDAAFTGGR